MQKDLSKVLLEGCSDYIKTPFNYYSLVVPTCRLQATVNFLKEWSSSIKDSIDAVHIVFDGHSSDIDAEMLRNIKFDHIVHVHSWDSNFIGESLTDNELKPMPPTLQELDAQGFKCFSRKDSAIRSYGFLLSEVYANLCNSFLNGNHPDNHVIYTLDDDCMPINDIGESRTSFFTSHLNNLYKFMPWSSTVPGIRLRGIPYYTCFSAADSSVSYNMVMSMGTWKGIPDFDATQRLSIGSKAESTELPLPLASIAAHPDVMYPICGMNLAFKASMLPVALFAPMGTASSYKRFDDIWFGVFAQAVLSLSKRNWCYGPPVINHTRLSLAMDCLTAEAPGISLNESVWVFISNAIRCYRNSGNVLEGFSIMDAAEYVIKAMSFHKDMTSEHVTLIGKSYKPELLDYVSIWCECLVNWLELLKRHVFNNGSFN
jgi:hypothetical protein